MDTNDKILLVKDSMTIEGLMCTAKPLDEFTREEILAVIENPEEKVVEMAALVRRILHYWEELPPDMHMQARAALATIPHVPRKPEPDDVRVPRNLLKQIKGWYDYDQGIPHNCLVKLFSCLKD